MSDKLFNVLFLCTGNSCRSIMAEAMLNTLGKGRFQAFSAGSYPTGIVNPHALEQIAHLDIETTGLRSKNWEEYSTADAPHMDFVITVCDEAAGEICPFWPGHPITAHWGIEDPTKAQGTDAEISHLFSRICREIKARLDLLLSLPIEKLEHLALQTELDKIGASKA